MAFVLHICLGYRNFFAFIGINHHIAILYTGILVAIELADLAAFFHAEEVLAGTYTRFLIQFHIRSFVQAVGEFIQFRSAVRVVDTRCPFYGSSFESVAFQRNFDTTIHSGSYVYQNCRVDVGRLWSRIVIKQVA